MLRKCLKLNDELDACVMFATLKLYPIPLEIIKPIGVVHIHLMRAAYTSNGGGVYVQWEGRIRPFGVAYTSNEGGVYI